MANPPGAYVSVVAASSSPQSNTSTGTWFVTGLAAAGPSGVVPINSIQDFNTYYGFYVNGGVTSRYAASGIPANNGVTLYDSLDVYFREGGIRAYVSRVVGVAAGAAGASTTITGSGTGTLATLYATGAGTWANSSATSTGTIVAGISGLIVKSATVGTGGFTLTVYYNGIQIGNTSPPLFSGTDIANWVSSLAAPGVLFNVITGAGTGTPTASIYYFAGGTDATTANADWTDSTGIASGAVAAFTAAYGPGQVSAPGNTTPAVWQGLANHAYSMSRVAVLDSVDAASATALTSTTTGSAAIQYPQTNAAIDSSYASIFAPWIKVPGIASTQPNTVSSTFTRLVPPSAFAAANMAAVDLRNDSNVPAAGLVNGACSYATDVSTTYSASDRATLNAAGVNVIRNINGQVAVYGFRSLALDSNWTALNNVRFRMQLVKDFDAIAEGYVYKQIDGKGIVFSSLSGALSGLCQQYWLRNSLFGLNPGDAFTVNAGPQVNTPATIAAGQINAQVNLRMSPQAEQVTVSVTKYLVSAPLPSY